MSFAHYRYVREITSHPCNRGRKLKAIGSYLAWNVGRRLLSDVDYAMDLVPGVSVVLSNRENYATLAYTCRVYDFEDMLFVMHMLSPGDCFGDFGANVGVYSVLAGSRGASVLAVEPVPDTFRRLCRNLLANSVKAVPVNCGLSDRSGTLPFTTDRGGMNKVARPGSEGTCEVDVLTADELAHQTTSAPCLLKIDVEGFEMPLLRGARKLLAGPVQAVIIELNGSGAEYGFSDDSVHATLIDAGFAPHRYDPTTRSVMAIDGINTSSFNTIFLKKSAIASLQSRLRSAAPVTLRSGVAY